uniref:Uncharacterized protein n=1 Tax=Anguilla anguilla TaxID=7936 RepID=A0A0E9RR92_ANGAN
MENKTKWKMHSPLANRFEKVRFRAPKTASPCRCFHKTGGSWEIGVP